MMDKELNIQNFKDCVKMHPELKFLKDVAYCDYETIRGLEDQFYQWIITNPTSKSLLIAIFVGMYSECNYCKLMYCRWQDVNGFTYKESIEADMYGLFKELHPAVRARVEKDFARLQEYMKTKNPALKRKNIFFQHR